MKKKLTVLLMGVLCFVGLQAQKSFSLEDAVNFALENNKQLKADRYDIEKSESAYKEARSNWLPQVDATLDYATYFNYEISLMGYDISYSNSSTGQLSASQVLFNGQILSGMQAANVGKKMAETSVELSELDVRTNVSNTYYQALTLKETLVTIDSSLSEMEDLVSKTEVMVRAGVMERTELDQLKVQLNNVRNTRLSMARNVDVVCNLLRFHLGLPVNEEIILTDNLDDIMLTIMSEGKLDDKFDINSNLNFQIMSQQVELNEKMLNSEKMAYVPTLAAYYQHNEKFLTSSDFDTNPTDVAGVTLSVPIFSGFQRKNKVAQQKIELLQAEANKEIIADQLYLQETQLRSDYLSKFEEYKNQKENVEVARRVFESYEHKFEQGVASGMDLTQANSTYLQAESSYLSSALSVLQARVAFFKLLNDL